MEIGQEPTLSIISTYTSGPLVSAMEKRESERQIPGSEKITSPSNCAVVLYRYSFQEVSNTKNEVRRPGSFSGLCIQGGECYLGLSFLHRPRRTQKRQAERIGASCLGRSRSRPTFQTLREGGIRAETKREKRRELHQCRHWKGNKSEKDKKAFGHNVAEQEQRGRNQRDCASFPL